MPDAGDRRKLADRWIPTDGQDLAAEVTARLLSGRSLTDLGLGVTDGRVDLRYFSAPIPNRLERFEFQGWFVEELGGLLEFRDVVLSHLDLTGASLPSLRFHGVRIENCIFREATCSDWRMWATHVSGTDFGGAKVRNAALGTWDSGTGNHWVRVAFRSADLRGSFWWGAVLEDCDFTLARLDGVTFEQCAVHRCTFAGPLKRVTFDERPLPDRRSPEPRIQVDFTDAAFDEVRFLGVCLDRVTLPDDPDLLVFHDYRGVVRQALQLLRGDDSRWGRMLTARLENNLRMMRSEHEDNVFNRRDSAGSGGPEYSEFAEELLLRAQRVAQAHE
jgi:uncharacterized protein YjbI with pentapeptide repeats